MGYITVLGLCYDGERQPVCLACMEQVNRERVARGLEPFAIHPNAYEPEPEQNVPND
jgi:hypothetical protein